MKKYINTIILILTCFTWPLLSGPWISVGDPWIRSDIEFLADTGVITVPITTWPLMWSGIKRDMDAAMEVKAFKQLSNQQQDALIRLKKEFRRQTGVSASIGIRLASDTEVIRGFSNTIREKSSVFIQRQDMGDQWAYNLNLEYVYNPYLAPGQTEDKIRYDGSYVTTLFDNFALGYGYIDKWWGPGWDSSLILTNNARPSPGIFLQRNYSTAFDTVWLNWMGPWTFQAFANALDDSRHINDAKFLGLSLSFKPFDSLEIGLRRTAQWGGAGRPESLSSFIDMFFGRDNCGDDGIDACGTNNSNEPGNQLAAVDVRWRLPFEIPITIYAQIMGEDEAGYLPSKKTHQLGMTLNVVTWQLPVQYFIEYSDTTTNNGGQYNVTYNHSLYRSGYRYFNRPMGISADTDSKVVSLGANFRLDNTKQLNLVLRDLNINIDNNGAQSINNQSVDSLNMSVQYQQQTKYGKINLYLDQYSDIIDQYNRQDNETRLGASWHTIF